MDILHTSAFLPILWQYNFFLHDKLCGLQQGTAVVPVYSFYFYQDMTSLVWLTVPPSSGKSIHTFNGGCGERKRDRRKEGGLLKRRHFCFSFNFFCDGDYQNANHTYIIHTRTVQYITKQSNRFTTALPHFTVTFTTAICPIPYRHISILRKHIFYYTIYLYKQTSYIYVVFGTRYEILLYSSLYSICTQLCSTILAYCTVQQQICTLSTHRSSHIICTYT